MIDIFKILELIGIGLILYGLWFYTTDRSRVIWVPIGILLTFLANPMKAALDKPVLFCFFVVSYIAIIFRMLYVNHKAFHDTDKNSE